MNNNYRNSRGKRIGAKKQSVNRTAIVWGVAVLIWIAFMIDLVMTRDPWWLMLIYTIGVFAVAFVIAKPGKFAERAYREGFGVLYGTPLLSISHHAEAVVVKEVVADTTDVKVLIQPTTT